MCTCGSWEFDSNVLCELYLNNQNDDARSSIRDENC